MHRFALLLLATASLALADLRVGDAAPALNIDDWVKGSAVRSFEPNHVYVVEFWATWCGPCIRGIPHLTELQEKHKDDVTIIGVSTKDNRGNNLGSVRQLVDAQGGRMDYTIAYCNSNRMWNDWMSAAGRGGIPSAFIVGVDGRITWIGHPASMDGALEAAVARIDRTAPGADATESEEAVKLKIRIAEALEEESWGEAIAGMSRLVRLDPIRYSGWQVQRIELLIAHNERAAVSKVHEAVRRTYREHPGEAAWVIAGVLRSPKSSERLIKSTDEHARKLLDLASDDPRMEVLRAERAVQRGDKERASEILAEAREEIEASKLHPEVKAQLDKEIKERITQLARG